MMKPRGHTAVMASKRKAPDSLEFFPTPPWGTRALCEHILQQRADLSKMSCWEPAAGEGHMAEVLREYFGSVHASDVFDYGAGYAVGSFVAERLGLVDDLAYPPGPVDWIITNPPFTLAEQFVARALSIARFGVAMFVRSSWLESEGRYESTFRKTPPTTVAIFSGRIALTEGRWEPDASTATSYAWVIWDKRARRRGGIAWIPPESKLLLTHADDARRFAVEEPGMFDEAPRQPKDRF